MTEMFHGFHLNYVQDECEFKYGKYTFKIRPRYVSKEEPGPEMEIEIYQEGLDLKRIVWISKDLGIGTISEKTSPPFEQEIKVPLYLVVEDTGPDSQSRVRTWEHYDTHAALERHLDMIRPLKSLKTYAVYKLDSSTFSYVKTTLQ